MEVVRIIGGFLAPFCSITAQHESTNVRAMLSTVMSNTGKASVNLVLRSVLVIEREEDV